MARHTRRLILWTTGVLLSLAVLAMLSIAVVIWGVDPDVFRSRIEQAATRALGRRVQLTGQLRWRPGLNFQVESRGGRIANAEGFGDAPLASWEALRLGVALRPLRNQQLVIGRIEVQGLQLDLVRGATGVNWNLLPGDPAQNARGLTLAVGSIMLREGNISYADRNTQQTWSAQQLSVDVGLPAQLTADALVFSNIVVKAQLRGAPLQKQGVGFQLDLPRFELDSTRRQVKAAQWHLKWNDADLGGSLQADMGAAFAARGKLHVAAPSLRRLLQSVSIAAPATRDAAALGALGFDTDLEIDRNAATLKGLSLKLDSTQVQGRVQLPSLSPLSARFELAADQVDVDRYLTPENQPGTPLTLPLKELKSLDARGVLTIQRASVAGAAAREMRIDVD